MTSIDQPPAEPAISAAVFMATLRRLHRRCGMTAGQISALSGPALLPRSTAYRFINPENHSLPKNRDQVLAFLKACRCSPAELQTMLRIWDRLSGHGGPEERSAVELAHKGVVPVPGPAKPGEGGIDAEERYSTMQMMQRQSKIAELVLADLRAAQNHADGDREAAIEVLLDLGTGECTCPVCTNPVTLTAADCEAVAAAPPPLLWTGRRNAWRLRVLGMTLLTLLIYPVGMLSGFARYDSKLTVIPFLLVGTALLLLLSSTLHRVPWNEVVTTGRLAAVAASSLIADALGWMASGSLLVGLMSGFSVCATAPIWLSLTRMTGLVTTTRGQFTLLASGWFGAVLGATAPLLGVRTAGAALTGIAGAIIAVMLLSSWVLPLPDEKSTTLQHDQRPLPESSN